MLLSMSLGDKPLLTDSERTTPYPHITYSGDEDVFGALTTFAVFADRTHITTCSSVVNAITICFLSYWIFNIEYPKNFRGILSFLDAFIFHKKSVRIGQKVSTFINKFWTFLMWVPYSDGICNMCSCCLWLNMTSGTFSKLNCSIVLYCKYKKWSGYVLKTSLIWHHESKTLHDESGYGY